MISGNSRYLNLSPTCHDSSRWESHLHAVVARDGHPQAGILNLKVTGARATSTVIGRWFDFEEPPGVQDVAKVQEPRRGWAHHEGQSGRDVGFPLAVLCSIAVHATTMTR